MLLLGGIGLGAIGFVVMTYGMIEGFMFMDTNGGPPAIVPLMQWVGFLSTLSGVAIVAFSIALWVWRVVRALRN